jgi:hypothetical protein
MVSLKDAVEAAQTDLKVLQIESIEGVKLVQALGQLSGVVSSLSEGGDAPILLARDACESIVDAARRAEDAGSVDAAERLRGINRALSPVVAGCYGQLKCETIPTWEG